MRYHVPIDGGAAAKLGTIGDALAFACMALVAECRVHAPTTIAP